MTKFIKRKRSTKFLFLATLISYTFTSIAFANDAVSEMRAGVAVADITPPIPYRMSGYFSERQSTGVKDPLHAKAIYFSQADIEFAWVFCDLVGIAPQVAENAREQAALQTGIPTEQISVAATHSHTGPLYFGALRNLFHQRAIERAGKDDLEKEDYVATLVESIAQAVQRAKKNARPTKLSAGFAIENRLSFNRRFHMKDGSVRFNPGQQNPEIVRVAGPIDPQVGLIKLADSNAKSFACIASFALHLDTVGGTEYSADYPYFLGKQLNSEYGDDFTTIYAAGTCGDINHIDVTTKDRRTAQQIGTMLAETVKDSLPNLANISQPKLAFARKVIDLPLQQYSLEQTAAAKLKLSQLGIERMGFLETVEAYKISALDLRGGKSMPVEVQAFRFSGEVAVVMLPGEVFVELGLAIKQASPFATTIVIELANDAPGYIPTRKAFAEGSYETVNSRLEPGSGEQIVEIAVGLLDELRAD